MSAPHITVAEIAEVLASPAGDPRREHLGDCVRCRLLVSRYQAFVSEPEHVPPGDLAAAEARLVACLDEQTRAGPSTVRRSLARPAKGSAWLTRWLGGPTWQPAFAVAAIAVIGAGVLWFAAERTRESPPPARVLRGAAGRGALHVGPPMTLPGGRVSLHWTGIPGADRYEVRFYAPELRELGAPASTADTTFTLEPAMLPGAASGDTLLVSIAAWNGEALLVRSTPRPMILPSARVMR